LKGIGIEQQIQNNVGLACKKFGIHLRRYNKTKATFVIKGSFFLFENTRATMGAWVSLTRQVFFVLQRLYGKSPPIAITKYNLVHPQIKLKLLLCLEMQYPPSGLLHK